MLSASLDAQETVPNPSSGARILSSFGAPKGADTPMMGRPGEDDCVYAASPRDQMLREAPSWIEMSGVDRVHYPPNSGSTRSGARRRSDKRESGIAASSESQA